MEKNMSAKTFDQVNALVEQYYKEQQSGKLKAGGETLKNIWAVARPVISLVAGIGIIPVKWRNILKALIAAVDAIVAS